MKNKFLVIVFSLVYLLVFDAGFLFAQVADATPPELLSFDFNPKSIDVSSGGSTIHVEAGAQDDISGVSSGFVVFRNGGQTYVASLTFGNGVLSGNAIIPQYAATGTYNIGNQRRLSTSDLQARGFPVELFNGNTPSGSNIVVGPISGVTITYPQVTKGGQTTVTSNTSGSIPPSGFKLGNPPTYYSISTTAQFNPPVEVCMNYDDTQFKNEKNLKLFHFENGAWANTTTSLDTINNIICGNVSSFSDFALAEDITVEHLIDDVQNSSIKPDVKQGLLDKLIAVRDAIERNQKKAAVNILKAFINQIKAQKDKAISNDQANLLTSDAQALINQLGGNLLSTIFKWVLFGWLDKFVNAMLGSKI